MSVGRSGIVVGANERSGGESGYKWGVSAVEHVVAWVLDAGAKIDCEGIFSNCWYSRTP